MKKTLVVVAFVLGCGAAASLPTGPKPAWVGADSAQYPDSDFLTGVGMVTVQADGAATQQAVDAAARVELTKKIEVSVSSEFTSLQAESTHNGVTNSTQSVQDLTREAVQGFELTGVDVKERWLDEASGVAYALAVWPKARAEALLKAKLAEAETAAQKALAEGDAKAASNVGVALKQYLTARLVLDKARKDAVLLRAVTGKQAPVPDDAVARSKLDQILSTVDLKVASGNGQRAKAQAGLPQPLIVEVKSGAQPLAGVPVVFELAGGSIDGLVNTDAAGQAAARVANAGALPGGEAVAVAHVDWAKLLGTEAPPSWLTTMRPLSANFQLVSRSLGTTRVLVKIVERIDEGTAPGTGAVQSAMSNQFASAGFGVKDGAALVARLPIEQLLTLDPKAFQAQARDLADLVIIGEAVSSFSSTLADDVVIHRARLNVRVVDLGSGEVVATASLEKKGQPGKGPDKAGKKALDALAAALPQDLPAQVKQKLGL